MSMPAPEVTPIQPVWPLPRAPGGPSDEEIRREFARRGPWHYAYDFEGGLSYPVRKEKPETGSGWRRRPLQRFAHFMPYALHSQGGSLRGKRVLDIACNSGFWAIQCALLGADVVAFDARQQLIDQADVIKRITGVQSVEFRVLDFWQMTPALLGRFDLVLNLGILYHLPKTIEALELTRAVAQKHILLDSTVYASEKPLVHVAWQGTEEIRNAATEGMVATPSPTAVELMLRHLQIQRWLRIPLRTKDMPADYVEGKRVSWLIEV
jgi:2-polyprenyl-3-methyl-5-hydroxy-6-metoxy-1,4-benzoquinol methylase